MACTISDTILNNRSSNNIIHPTHRKNERDGFFILSSAADGASRSGLQHAVGLLHAAKGEAALVFVDNMGLYVEVV